MSNSKSNQDTKNNQAMSDKVDEMKQMSNKKNIPAGIAQKQ